MLITIRTDNRMIKQECPYGIRVNQISNNSRIVEAGGMHCRDCPAFGGVIFDGLAITAIRCLHMQVEEGDEKDIL